MTFTEFFIIKSAFLQLKYHFAAYFFALWLYIARVTDTFADKFVFMSFFLIRATL